MNSWSRVANAILTGSDWFDGCSHVLDVGGGDGVNAMALAHAFPALKVTVLDLEGAVVIARRNADDSGIGSRIQTVAGDIFSTPFPAGCDCVLLANQIPIWSAADNYRLIVRAYEALAAGGRLVIFNEFVNDALDGPLYAALDNVYFATLPTPDSQLYPARDCIAWALRAGFREAAWFPGACRRRTDRVPVRNPRTPGACSRADPVLVPAQARPDQCQQYPLRYDPGQYRARRSRSARPAVRSGC
jgi:hypothetical protein